MSRKRKYAIVDNDRVEAVGELPGVPAGTPGRVVVAYGLSWRRYRVDFDNGVSLGNLDEKYLTRTG